MLALILSYLLLYKYLAIFILVFSAAVIIPWPVNTAILAVGAFSSQGYFNFWISLAVAISANVSGDLFDYWLTRKYGQKAIKNFYIKHNTHFARL
jgi:membrane protein DedA with SNARE-associated domain